jgi:SAM-dependent methyltransferase
MGLRITQNEFTRIRDMLQYQAEHSGTEVEARIKKHIEFYDFSRLLKYLDNVYQRHSAEETLDIMGGRNDVRITVNGMETVQYYCQYDQLPPNNVTAIQKTKTPPLNMQHHLVRISSSTETPIEVRQVMGSVLVGEKTYRLKNRVSYMVSPNIRIDCTIVKQAERKESIKFVHTWTKPKYEVEIECVEKTEPSEFLRVVAEVLKVVENVEYLLSETAAPQLLKEYMDMIQSKLDSRKARGDPLREPRAYFAGPQPVSFERKHILQDTGVIYTTPYGLTHKADGERGLLVISKEGRIYVVNNMLKFKYTNLTVGIGSCVLDAEVVRNANGRITLWIFDVYVWKGKFVTGEDLRSRLELANEVVTPASSASVYDIAIKTFLYTDADQGTGETYIQGFYKCCKQLLNEQTLGKKSGTLPFKTDGIILTPSGAVEGRLFGTWFDCFKWKPPHENTIDFLCKFHRDPLSGEYEVISKQNGIFRVLDLYVGKDCKPSTPWQYFAERDTMTRGYLPDEFNPRTAPGVIANKCFLRYSEDSPDHFSLENELIIDNSIIEMSWRKEGWVPLRVRQDKTELWNAIKKIGGTANDSDVAGRIWQTLQYPVTEEHLVGSKVVTSMDVPSGDDDQYYVNTKTRNESENLNMNNFHNLWIKERLLKWGKKSKSLLDLGCGKGGDLHKWTRAKFDIVVGFDKSRDNITNSKNGIYARMLQDEETFKDKTYVFLPFDVRLPLQDVSSETYPDDKDKELAEHLWGIKRSVNKAVVNSIPYGLAKKKFEVISCQFAIHYFFENDTILETFCKNVSENLQAGGLFIATCFDGVKINELLNGGTRVEGKAQNGGNLWVIQREYGRYEARTGQAIMVYVETINQFLKEYLVDMNLLTAQMERHGLVLEKTQLFGEAYNDLMNMSQQNKKAFEAASAMKEVEKTFSFLNRYYVFRKR